MKRIIMFLFATIIVASTTLPQMVTRPVQVLRPNIGYFKSKILITDSLSTHQDTIRLPFHIGRDFPIMFSVLGVFNALPSGGTDTGIIINTYGKIFPYGNWEFIRKDSINEVGTNSLLQSNATAKYFTGRINKMSSVSGEDVIAYEALEIETRYDFYRYIMVEIIRKPKAAGKTKLTSLELWVWPQN